MVKWKLTVEGIPHEVAYKDGFFKSRILVDGSVLPRTALEVTREGKVTKTRVPVGDDFAELYCLLYNRKLVYHGIDLKTGEAYVPLKITPMTWVFLVLYALSFFVICGGAVGAFFDVLGVAYTAKIASDERKSGVVRTLLCTLLFAVIVVAEFLLALLINSLI